VLCAGVGVVWCCVGEKQEGVAMKSKNELKPGDGVDVRVLRWNGSFVNGHVDAREAWIPGAVVYVDDSTVTVMVYEFAERRTYPIDSTDWRPAR